MNNLAILLLANWSYKSNCQRWQTRGAILRQRKHCVFPLPVLRKLIRGTVWMYMRHCGVFYNILLEYKSLTYWQEAGERAKQSKAERTGRFLLAFALFPMLSRWYGDTVGLLISRKPLLRTATQERQTTKPITIVTLFLYFIPFFFLLV